MTGQALYFHIGRPGLGVGTELIPGGPGGRSRMHQGPVRDEEQLDWVWLSQDAQTAIAYALYAMNHFDIQPAIYLARPTAKVEERTGFHSGSNAPQLITKSAVVVAQFPWLYERLRTFDWTSWWLDRYPESRSLPNSYTIQYDILEQWRLAISRGTPLELPSIGVVAKTAERAFMDAPLIGTFPFTALGWEGETYEVTGPITFTTTTGVQARVRDTEIGYLHWRPDGEIVDIGVMETYQRKGVATQMLACARQINPGVHHSRTLTEDGRAWSQKVAAWRDVRNKAREIRSGGGVKVIAAAGDQITAEVKSTTGSVYQTSLLREPGTKSVAMWECFLPDAPVLMADGTERPISDVVPGDGVITHEGRIARVVRAEPKPYDGDLVTVRFRGDYRPLIATAGHEVYAANRDYALRGAGRDVLYKATGSTIPVLAPRDGWIPIEQLASGDYLSRSIVGSEEPLVITCPAPLGNRAHGYTHDDLDVKVDADLAYWLGWYMAEGSLVGRGHRVVFSLALDEGWVCERLDAIAQHHFGVVGTRRVRESTIDYRVSHFALAHLARTLIGTGSTTKRLAPAMLTLPIPEQESFMDAWVAGDGHAEPRGVTTLHAANETSLRQAREILGRLGVVANLRMAATNPGGLASTQNAGPIWRLQWAGGRRTINQFRQDGMIWHKITSVERRPYVGEVWDIEVEEDHSFRAYGMNVHNCTCPWSAYSWGRSGRWKKYEGRMCAHALALVYEAQAQEWGGNNVTEGPGHGEEITFYEAPPTGEWRVDTPVRPGDMAIGASLRIAARSERSGVPEVDQVIEEFLAMTLTDGLPVCDLRDPVNAHGACQSVTEEFVELANRRGLKAYVTPTTAKELGYRRRGRPAGEVLDADANIVSGFYEDHVIASVYVDGRAFPIEIDFTATQYGYKALPKVRASASPGARAYRGFTLQITDLAIAKRFTEACAANDTAAAGRIIADQIRTGDRVRWWSGGASDPGRGLGTWWCSSETDATNYSFEIVDSFQVLGVSIVLCAEVGEEWGEGEVDGTWTTFWHLDPNTPVSLLSATATVPTAAGAKAALEEFAGQGQWATIYDLGFTGGDGGRDIELPLGSLPRTAVATGRKGVKVWRGFLSWSIYGLDNRSMSERIELSDHDLPQNRALAQRFHDGTVTADDLLKIVHLNSAGVYWAEAGPHPSEGGRTGEEVARSYAGGQRGYVPGHGGVDETQLLAYSWDERGPVGTQWEHEYVHRGIGTAMIVLVAELDEDAAGFDGEGMLELDDGQPLNLLEIQYNAGWGWRTVPIGGRRITASLPDRPLYHGSFHELADGTMLRAGAVPGNWDNQGSLAAQVVWMTDDPDDAMSWARQAAREMGVDPELAHVYEVEPVGEVRQWKAPAHLDRMGIKHFTAESARVLARTAKVDRFDGVSLKQDDDGWYVTTHRARSDSYESPEAIPQADIDFIESTGALRTADRGRLLSLDGGLTTQASKTAGVGTIYRGLRFSLDPYDYYQAMAEGRWEDAARMIVEGAQSDSGGLGAHWTLQPDVAWRFAAVNSERTVLIDPGSIYAYVSAVIEATYESDQIEYDPNKLDGSQGYGWEGKEEYEVPLKRGAQLNILAVHLCVPRDLELAMTAFNEGDQKYQLPYDVKRVPLPMRATAKTTAESPPWTDTTMSIAALRAIALPGRLEAMDAGDSKIVDLALAIAVHGITQPLFVEETNQGLLMTDGHHRLIAAEEIGLTELPVRVFANTPEGRSAANRAMVALAKVASTGAYYHLTDKVDFQLNPRKRPTINTTMGGEMPPGIFLTKDPEHWITGYGYRQPWIVEFAIDGSIEGGYTNSSETFVPAEEFSKLRIVRVLPMDAFAREEYGGWGWTEDDLATTFDTFEPISPADLNNYSKWRGYRYPGDARQADSTWQDAYSKRVKKWRRGKGNAIASKTAARPDWGLDQLDLPEQAYDGDCLLWSPHIVEHLQTRGVEAHVVTVLGYLGENLVAFAHQAVLADGLVVDATATQFNSRLDPLLVLTPEEYRTVLGEATGTTIEIQGA